MGRSQIALEISSGIVTIRHITQYITYRLANLHEELSSRQVLGGTEAACLREHRRHITQVLHARSIKGDIRIQREVVAQALGFMIEDYTLHRELHTHVAGRTDILVLEVIASRHILTDDQVLGGIPIEVDRTGQALVEEAVVDTEVTGDGGLPFEVRVRSDFFATADYQDIAGTLTHIEIGHLGRKEVRMEVSEVHIVVTRHT